MMGHHRCHRCHRCPLERKVRRDALSTRDWIICRSLIATPTGRHGSLEGQDERKPYVLIFVVVQDARLDCVPRALQWSMLALPGAVRADRSVAPRHDGQIDDRPYVRERLIKPICDLIIIADDEVAAVRSHPLGERGYWHLTRRRRRPADNDDPVDTAASTATVAARTRGPMRLCEAAPCRYHSAVTARVVRGRASTPLRGSNLPRRRDAALACV